MKKKGCPICGRTDYLEKINDVWYCSYCNKEVDRQEWGLPVSIK